MSEVINEVLCLQGHVYFNDKGERKGVVTVSQMQGEIRSDFSRETEEYGPHMTLSTFRSSCGLRLINTSHVSVIIAIAIVKKQS